MGAGGFGALLRGCVEAGRGGEPFTMYVKDVAHLAGVSERTIWRLLDIEEWPTPETIRKLSGAIPSMKFVTADSATARGQWEVVRPQQSNLPKGSTLTIVTAAENPKALDDAGIARTLAENVLQKNFKYVFLYPPHARADSDRLKQVVVLTVMGAFSRLLLNETSGGDPSGTPETWLHLLTNAVNVFHTSEATKSWEFWGRMPRYTVLHNLRTNDKYFPRYGMYWDSGISAYSAPPIEPLAGEPVSGWTYLNKKDQETFYELLEDPKQSVLDRTTFDAWPIPERS